MRLLQRLFSMLAAGLALATSALAPVAFAQELRGVERDSFLRSLEETQRLGNKLTTPCPTCGAGATPAPGNASTWMALTPADAQCTPGAKAAGHHARIRVSTFGKNSSLTIETFPSPRDGAVRLARRTHPNASYIGNGPIFMKGGQPNGYVKSAGKVLSPIDCVAFRENAGNLGHENSVFVRYRPRKLPPRTGYRAFSRYRVISTDRLCQQLQPTAYVSWLQSTRSDDVAAFLKDSKKWEAEGEDLVEGEQIDFAIQSGPAVLREGEVLLADYNSGTGYRSYIGVSASGEPLVVEADGNIGSYCLGRYLKTQGVRDLLHRDSFIADANFLEADGNVTGYPAPNPNARAASILVISP